MYKYICISIYCLVNTYTLYLYFTGSDWGESFPYPSGKQHVFTPRVVPRSAASLSTRIG